MEMALKKKNFCVVYNFIRDVCIVRCRSISTQILTLVYHEISFEVLSWHPVVLRTKGMQISSHSHIAFKNLCKFAICFLCISNEQPFSLSSSYLVGCFSPQSITQFHPLPRQLYIFLKDDVSGNVILTDAQDKPWTKSFT